MSRHEHLAPDRILDLALGEGGERARREVEACGRCGALLAELAGFVARARGALAEADAAGVSALAERVLARTTHQDVGWGGDWRLVRAFVTKRWRASWVVRLAAASLLVHLAALPLLAYYGLFKEAPAYRLSFETAPALPAPPPEPEREPETEAVLPPVELPDVGEDLVRDELNVQNALQWARHHLGRGLPEGDESDAKSGVTRLLALRARRVRDASPGDGESPDPLELTPPFELATPLEHVLWLDILLDAYVLTRRAPIGFGEALSRLGGGETRDVRMLERAALARSAAYGLLGRHERARLEVLGGRDGASHALEDPLRRGAPVDPAWVLALQHAVPGVLEGDPVGRAWLASVQ